MNYPGSGNFFGTRVPINVPACVLTYVLFAENLRALISRQINCLTDCTTLLQAALMANTEVLKEPRGFIKFIEIVSKQC